MLARAVSHFLLVFLTLIYNVSCQAGSLTFVIDDTRSMGKDIAQVRSSVDSIMDIVLEEKSSLISNIVLVTFNDPKIRLRKITNSREELKKAMANVKVHNYFNHDCPEMALSGVKLALESSLLNSYVYVFTDATAKDYELSEEIKQLCQRKQSQIFFVLTGDCRRPQSKPFLVYNEIANAGSGLAIRVDKNQVKDVLNTIRETIKGNKTVLTSKVTPANTKTDVPFLIDDLTENAIVSTSGEDVSLEIKGPPDHKDLDIEKIMWTRHGKVIKIKNPYPGQYVATVKGSSATSVIVTGRSDFLFQHGFSEQEPKSNKDTTPQPLSKTLTHLSLSVKDPNHSVRIQSAQILDMNENVIKNLSLKELSPNFYTTEPFAAPSDMFKVAVIGEAIKTGEPVRRITKIPITPQAPPSDKPLAKAPVVEIEEGASVEVARGAALTLTCKVSAYPEPQIIWTNDKNITVQSKSSTLQLPYDFISYLKIPKATENTKYHCYAQNILNNSHQSTNVVTKHPITVEPVPKDTKIAYGKSSTLNCGVSSPLPLEIKWYHVDKSTGKTEQVTSSKKYSISSDGKQLTITSMDVDLVGKYTCKAHVRENPNEKQEMSTNVEINGLDKAPVVEIEEGASVEVARGAALTLTCKVSAYPEPEIIWTNDKNITVQSESSTLQLPHDYISYLKIPKATENNKYHCYAKNVLNNAHKSINVVTKHPITVQPVPRDTKIAYGKPSTINCGVSSPLPLEIKWYHVDKSTGKTEQVTSSEKYSISSDGKQLTITSMDVDLVGKYTCKAHVRDNPNEEQEMSTNVELDGLVPPKISPDTKLIEVKEHTPATIKCKILNGIPEPKISWLFKASGSDSSYNSIPGSGAELRIPSAGLHDAGSYRCIASNVEGQDQSTVAELEVLKAPVVTIEQGANVVVEYDSPLALTCKVTANPPPTIMWSNEKGDLLLLEMEKSGSKTEFESNFLKSDIKNSGVYKCQAENNQGIQSASIQVTVLPAFSVHSQPADIIEVPYGKSVDLKCDIKSNRPMKIEWFYAYNSTTTSRPLILSNKAYDVSGDNTLIIQSVDFDLTGVYTCKASLIDDPSVTKSFTTNVDIEGLEPPEIDPLPIKKEINETDSTTITCTILGGMPKPKISWQMKAAGSTEYRPIAGSGLELHIKKAALANGGLYKCLAENVAGHREQVVTELVVFKAPKVTIIKEAASNVVPYGSRLTLACLVTANPEPTIVWKDSVGNTLPGTSSAMKSRFKYTHTMTRANVKASDKYSCTATNDQGTATQSVQMTVSSPFKVHSKPAKDKTNALDSTTSKYGAAVTLKCGITSNFPMKIRWYHLKDSTSEKKEIESSEQYTISSNGAELKINAMDIGLDGKYTCKASLLEDPNKQVEHTTQVKIDGFEIPVVNGDGNKYVLVGSSVSIKCNVVQGAPKPQLSWQFRPMNSDKSSDMNYAGDELYIANVTVEDSGSYTCTAKNSLGSSAHVVGLTVKVPAKIISDDLKVYEGLIGDIALRIPCEAIGSPKPTFTWKVNDAVVSPGTKYDIEDGALIVKHPERSERNYTCTATNTAGSDSKSFTGVVDEILMDDGPTHEVFILEGESKNITCTLKHSEPSTVNWFIYYIEPQRINKTDVPYVTVTNAKVEDAGNYTCHVSDAHGSATETFLVNVGNPPRFKYPQEDPLVDWTGDIEDVLTCSVQAKPEANVQWTFNGEPLVRANSEELNIFKWGHYSCNVSNDHGSVQREFEVKPTVCLISRNKDEAPHMPLMLTEELTWPDYETSGEYMKMKPGDKLTLSCYNHEESPNSFQIFPAVSELEATCEMGDTFKVDGKPYKLKDLKCTNEISPSVVRTGMQCLTDTAELLIVGYNSVEAYEVCFDHATNMPLYTRVLMSRTNNVPSAADEWFQYPGIGDGTTESYTCKTPSSSCCYAKSQLVSARDFSYGAAQNSSFIDPLNAIPYWRSCDKDRSSWKDLEDVVKYELTMYPSFVVWSGVHTLQVKNGIIIPRYLWKVVRASEVESVALVYVNDGTPTADDVKCENKCASIMPWFNSRDKYTYCCTVAEFIEAFGIPGDVVGESLDQSPDQSVEQNKDYSSDE